MRSRIAAAMVMFAVLGTSVGAAQESAPMVEATTATGERVRLYANGRWEFVDQAKQAEAKKVADTYPENLPAGAQGGLLGVGRTIVPGDKDYNRGSLNPKMR